MKLKNKIYKIKLKRTKIKNKVFMINSLKVLNSKINHKL